MALQQGTKRPVAIPDRLLAPILLAVAGIGWWWSAVSADQMRSDMSADSDMDMTGATAMSLAAFLVAWVAMMAAMMLPAVLPVVKLYSKAAARGAIAPVAVFLSGYGAIWSAVGLPVFYIWQRLDEPLAMATPTAGRVAGTVLVASAAYQLSPLKTVCLRHCRSPLSLFMLHGGTLNRASGAIKLGAHHGLFCLGCCWMLMAVLVALGTMDLRWMVVVAAIILLEKVTPMGERVATVAAIAFLGLGVLLLFDPLTIASLT